MAKKTFLILYFSLFSLNLYANSQGEQLSQKLHLKVAYKAISQWERVFTSEKKMKRYKIDTLSSIQKEQLRHYLINHAIDSDHPTIAGEF